MKVLFIMSLESIQKLQSLGPLESAAAAVTLALSALYIHNNLPTMPQAGPDRPKEILDAIANKEDIYYFGVGSNLSRERLENRSVCGKMIHPISMEPCIIHNCRLAFNLVGAPPLEPAFGSLEPLPSFYERKNSDADHPSILKRSDSEPVVAYGEKECHGALIKLSAHDYSLVHRSEGGDMGKLCGYEEIIVTCVPYDRTKPPVKAVAFRVREHRRTGGQDPCPSKRYMDIIRQGAAELGLEDSYQQWLKDHPVQHTSKFTAVVGIYSTLFTFSIADLCHMHWFLNIQSMLLYRVLVQPTMPIWKQIAGEIAAVFLMFPTACLGFVSRAFLEYSGLMPPELKKWITNLEEGLDDE